MATAQQNGHDPDLIGEAVAQFSRLQSIGLTADLPGGSRHTPRTARERVRRALNEWRLPAETIDTAELIVSELVTNAVVHTASERIDVIVVFGAETLRLCVRDRGPHCGIDQQSPGPDAETGRGLLLVSALADGYGWWPVGAGSAVWAALDVPASAAGDVIAC